MKNKVGIILGSNRPNRIGGDVAQWVKKTMEHEKLEIDIIDLAKINLPFLDEPNIPAQGNYQQEHTKNWSKTIKQYDGFVLVFPQYNWGYPAVLKNALDYLYDEWRHRPVSIMVYGGHGGFQGLISMKLVTQGLNMYNMSVNPPLNISKEMFNENNQFIDIDHSFKKISPQVKMVSEEFISLFSSEKGEN
ncbi:NADPH-dependent FMN reductase [Enterococcus dispar]|nr:NAD(P)H-dependent oxidoreductase [Enterococcus dispar]MCU7358275.1 NAD(P)H-dependent oxidoreductase [Enterococcus dispar]MDT2706435.1 NAD(P)H-dependent oxidoreductase [Enterococcus dispar]WCG33371.1 NAD(P)H-dependent oxidoreductase [Enterococcus dispar]